MPGNNRKRLSGRLASVTPKNLAMTIGMIGCVWVTVFLLAGPGAATVATIFVLLWGLIGLLIT